MFSVPLSSLSHLRRRCRHTRTRRRTRWRMPRGPAMGRGCWRWCRSIRWPCLLATTTCWRHGRHTSCRWCWRRSTRRPCLLAITITCRRHWRRGLRSLQIFDEPLQVLVGYFGLHADALDAGAEIPLVHDGALSIPPNLHRCWALHWTT